MGVDAEDYCIFPGENTGYNVITWFGINRIVIGTDEIEEARKVRDYLYGDKKEKNVLAVYQHILDNFEVNNMNAIMTRMNVINKRLNGGK